MSGSVPPVEIQLAIINTKLDVLIEQRTDHESRLRALERFKWIIFGVAAVSGPVFQQISAAAK